LNILKVRQISFILCILIGYLPRAQRTYDLDTEPDHQTGRKVSAPTPLSAITEDQESEDVIEEDYRGNATGDTTFNLSQIQTDAADTDEEDEDDNQTEDDDAIIKKFMVNYQIAVKNINVPFKVSSLAPLEDVQDAIVETLGLYSRLDIGQIQWKLIINNKQNRQNFNILRTEAHYQRLIEAVQHERDTDHRNHASWVERMAKPTRGKTPKEPVKRNLTVFLEHEPP
jgi:hypothetical protein